MRAAQVRDNSGRPRLAILIGAVMLALATGLSAVLVAQRRNLPTGPRVLPAGWAVSFTPPAGWDQSIVRSYLTGDAAYRFEAPSGPRRWLRIERVLDPQGRRADKLCEWVMSKSLPRSFGLLGTLAILRSATIEEGALGPLSGAQAKVDGKSSGHLFAVGIDPTSRDGTEAYVFQYHREGSLTPRDLETAQVVTRSFRLEREAGRRE
jgi:hypothetical protein